METLVYFLRRDILVVKIKYRTGLGTWACDYVGTIPDDSAERILDKSKLLGPYIDLGPI